MWGDLRKTELGLCTQAELDELCGQPNCQRKMGAVKTTDLTGGGTLKAACVQWRSSPAPPAPPP